MLQDLENRAKKAYSTIKNNIKPKIIGTILAGALTYSANDAQAQRIIESHLQPAAFGYAGETINLNEFQVEHYATNQENTFLQVVEHATRPNDYMQMRKIITVAPGDTTLVERLVALPNETTEGENLGSLAPNIEIPGTNPGISNIYELQSAVGFGIPYFVIQKTGTKEFWFDLDSIQTEAMQQKVQNTINKWKDMPEGYNLEQLASYHTFHSNQETPPGHEPGQLKIWIVEGVQNVGYNGEIDIEESIIRLNRWAYNQSTCDEEITSAMISSVASPFFNQEIDTVPDAYKKMVGIVEFSQIIDPEGYPTIYLPIGNTWPADPGIYDTNAELNEQIPGNGITIQELIQRNQFNSEGIATTNLDEIITNTPQTTMPMTISNYPNPFNSTTNITYTIPEETKVNITIYDIKGRKIQEIIQEQQMSAGTHQTQWKTNASIPSGTYIYKITTNKETKTGKTTITK